MRASSFSRQVSAYAALPGPKEAFAVCIFSYRARFRPPPGWARFFPAFERSRPPLVARQAIKAVAHFLEGEINTRLDAIEIELNCVSAWERRVYSAAREIRVGTTMTYGTLAERLGDSGLARAVGQALGRNPWPIIIPCHRITASAGAIGGFSAPGGRDTKMKLLELEGALAATSLPLFAGPG